MAKIQKSVFLLNWFSGSIINWPLQSLYNMQSMTVYHLQQINKTVNSWPAKSFLSNNRIIVFLEQKKNQITANTWRDFQLLEAVISSGSDQIHFRWNILSIPTKVNPLLRNLGIVITWHKIKTYFNLLQEIYWVLIL